jgi:hypothetical protein
MLLQMWRFSNPDLVRLQVGVRGDSPHDSRDEAAAIMGHPAWGCPVGYSTAGGGGGGGGGGPGAEGGGGGDGVVEFEAEVVVLDAVHDGAGGDG